MNKLDEGIVILGLNSWQFDQKWAVLFFLHIKNGARSKRYLKE